MDDEYDHVLELDPAPMSVHEPPGYSRMPVPEPTYYLRSRNRPREGGTHHLTPVMIRGMDTRYEPWSYTDV